MQLFDNKKQKKKHFIPSVSIGLILLFLGISWLLHVVSIVGIPILAPKFSYLSDAKKKQVPIKLKFKVKDKKKNRSQEFKSKIEVLQEESDKIDPVKSRLGYKDHYTKKEKKLARQLQVENALDPGRPEIAVQQKKTIKKADKKRDRKAINRPDVRAKKRSSTKKLPTLKMTDSQGVPLIPKIRKPRNQYENLLNNSIALLETEVSTGYQDYIDEELEIGNAIDINTQEYRYIGYFTNLRKAIALAWVYPSRAVRRGLHGNVFLKFTILKNGKISRVAVLDSSGHKILDHAVVDAIKLAAPFAPLPHSFGQRLKIKGTFRYTLH